MVFQAFFVLTVFVYLLLKPPLFFPQDSLKKGIGESSESVEIEDFIDEESSYSSDEDFDRK